MDALKEQKIIHLQIKISAVITNTSVNGLIAPFKDALGIVNVPNRPKWTNRILGIIKLI